MFILTRRGLRVGAFLLLGMNVGPQSALGQLLESVRHGFSWEGAREMQKLLRSTIIDTKSLKEAHTVKELLNQLYKDLSEQGIDLPIFLDLRSFSAIDTRNPYDFPVKLPAPYRKVRLVQFLSDFVGALPGKATFLIRRSAIEIKSTRDPGGKTVFNQNVFLVFDNVTLKEALEEIAESYGVTIVLDPKIEKKSQQRISAKITNATLRATLIILAAMGDLAPVFLDDAVYITSRARSRALQDALDR